MKVLLISEQRLDVLSPRHCLQCPVEDWLGFLGHRWNALLLWHLQDGARRHSELAALLPGVSPKVLSERLQGLEARGLLERFLITGFPRGVGYGLTSFGKALVPVLNQLEVWSRHFDHPVA